MSTQDDRELLSALATLHKRIAKFNRDGPQWPSGYCIDELQIRLWCDGRIHLHVESRGVPLAHETHADAHPEVLRPPDIDALLLAAKRNAKRFS